MSEKERNKPSCLAETFLRMLLLESEKHDLLGDYEEYYNEISENRCRFIAGLWYWMQIVIFLPKSIWDSTKWSLVMIRNYLKIAIRNIQKQKMYSLINIIGLALGMACCIFLLLWVQHQMSFDTFHDNAKNLFRLEVDIPKPTNRIFHGYWTPFPMGPALKENIPEIKHVIRWRTLGSLLVRYGEKQFYESQSRAVGSSFLQMFSFPLISGNPESALSRPYSIVISEAVATKYFGNENPLGKVLTINNNYMFTVTGVMKDFPNNSTLTARILVPFDFYKEVGRYYDNWLSNDCQTWIELYDYNQALEVSLKINDLYNDRSRDTYNNTFPAQSRQAISGYLWKFMLMPLTDINLHGIVGYSMQRKMQRVHIFFILALVIMLIASINYINLSTARSTGRAKEVGLRKVVGAEKSHIMIQFLGESLLFILISIIIALMLVALFLQSFNNLTDQQFTLSSFCNFHFILYILGLGLFAGISAGAYPALYLSSFPPVKVLKVNMYKSRQSALYRKSLVVVQFSLSVCLLISTIVAFTQLQFMLNANVGYEKEQLIYIPLRNGTHNSYTVLKENLKRNPLVVNVSGIDNTPTQIQTSWNDANWNGKDPNFAPSITKSFVDFDFIETMKIEMKEGRSFSKSFPTDETQAFLINEEMQKLMGTHSAVGQHFSFMKRTGIIVGVMKNFNHCSLVNSIEPFVFMMGNRSNRRPNYLVARLQKGNITSAIKSVSSTWEKINPQFPFEYTFFDDDFAEMYQSNRQMSLLFRYAAVFAIVIACIGLFGMVSFMSEKRKKEIGIRKTLGASVSGITVMLSQEFLKCVIFANVIACPVAYLLMKKWLEDYAYKIAIAWWIFVLTIMATIIIAVLTVGYQSIKSSLANPVESLRYE